MTAQEMCPCGTGKEYKKCCLPLLCEERKADTALELMRSRYTAFTKNANDYLLASWAGKTRPQKLDSETTTMNWIGLEILETEMGSEEDTSGTVLFAARFIIADTLHTMREKSRFIKEKGVWYYLDGTPESTSKKIARNSQCPCGSGKKFKRCCLQ